MALDLHILRSELDYLATIEECAFGILMDNGNMNYLQELEIDSRGYLTCYMPHVDDYYYVSKEVTVLPDNFSNWIDYLYYKDEHDKLTLFSKYIIDKYT
jgi:hypothetical protein